MSGIGFWELIILFLIGLIVLGPERLPRVANQVGGWLGQARRMTRVMKRQLEDEIDFENDFSIKPPPKKKPDVSKPQYVHDQPDELPDDYSPEHDDQSIGSGVDDDPGEVDADSIASIETGSVESAVEDAEAESAPKPKPKKKKKKKKKTKKKKKKKSSA